MKREVLIRYHATDIVRKLHDVLDDQLILVADRTLRLPQEKTENEYKRKVYLGQKKVPLCKPFTLCLTDGYVVDVLGPFYANEKDVKILKRLLMKMMISGICCGKTIYLFEIENFEMSASN